MLDKEIYEKFRDCGDDNNGILKDYFYIPINVGLKFINICRENDFAILGLDLLQKKGEGWQPFDYINNTYDLDRKIEDWNEYVNETCINSVEFINNIMNNFKSEINNIYIDFSIADEKKNKELEKRMIKYNS